MLSDRSLTLSFSINMYHWRFFIRLVGTFILFEKEIMVVYSAYNIIECFVVLIPLNLNVKSYWSIVPVLLLLNFWSGSIAIRYIPYYLQIRSVPNLSVTRICRQICEPIETESLFNTKPEWYHTRMIVT